jgi:hypothetical protein
MLLIAHFLPLIVGLLFVCAIALGVVLAYHFSRFSPSRHVTVATIGIYAIGIVALMLIVSYTLTLI